MMMTTTKKRTDTSLSGKSFIRACYASAFLLLFSAAPLAVAHNAPSPQSSNPSKNDYALIYGTVWGPDNHSVAGVPIKIRRATDKKPKWELTSDRSGEFAQRVPAGGQDYIIEADIKMPKGQPKPQVKTHIEDNERQDVSIHLTKEELPSR
jgi:hypothetical protein